MRGDVHGGHARWAATVGIVNIQGLFVGINIDNIYP